MRESKVKWRIEQSAGKFLLYIYDDVTEYGEFNWETWNYEESETSSKYFRDQLQTIPDNGEIELHINSNGGSVKEGTAIYNLLKQKQAHKTGIVDGVAHSIAFLILQACDVRKMGLGTSALIHNMWMACYGNAAQLRKYAEDLDILSQSNRKVFMERSTISEEELQALMEKETYLTPENALAYGLIDEVIQNTKGGLVHSEEMMEALKEQVRQVKQELAGQKSFHEQLAMMQEKPKGSETKNTEPRKPDAKNAILEAFKKMEVK